MLDVADACTKGLEAVQKKDMAAALEQAKRGRKIAHDSQDDEVAYYKKEGKL